MTGAGWGGCVVALVENRHMKEVSQRVKARYLAITGIQADTFVCLPGAHARLVTKLA
ncbi:MAG: hypothetical protein ACPGWR_12025 [Ardenticatenaceae bacterium]